MTLLTLCQVLLLIANAFAADATANLSDIAEATVIVPFANGLNFGPFETPILAFPDSADCPSLLNEEGGVDLEAAKEALYDISVELMSLKGESGVLDTEKFKQSYGKQASRFAQVVSQLEGQKMRSQLERELDNVAVLLDSVRIMYELERGNQLQDAAQAQAQKEAESPTSTENFCITDLNEKLSDIEGSIRRFYTPDDGLFDRNVYRIEMSMVVHQLGVLTSEVNNAVMATSVRERIEERIAMIESSLNTLSLMYQA